MTDAFDYLIVGAGSAGCVIANRLSENPKNRVCLIEAGPSDHNPFIHIPLGFMRVVKSPVLNWQYETVPQTHAGNRVLPIAGGRVLGGSSSINGTVYTRGHSLDYDSWAELGIQGWSWKDVVPYFQRSEHNENFADDAEFHGRSGPLNVKLLDEPGPLSEEFLRAGKTLGYEVRADISKLCDGFGRRQVTHRRGLRCSTARAFITPIRNRANLTVLTNALVRKVVIEGRRAVGVEISRAGKVEIIRCRSEVIVSAGAVGSPKILMLSGIGDGSALREKGIDVVHNLPGVGKNLQDHVAATIGFRSASTVPYGLSLRALPKRAMDVFKYVFQRKGMFASTSEGGAFIRTDPSLPRPDIQFSLVPALLRQVGRVNLGHGFAAIVTVLHPESHGEVRLASNDPDTKPLVDPRYLSAQADADTLVRGLKIARKMFNLPEFTKFGGREIDPGPEVVSDKDLEDYARGAALSIFHLVGTCRMGNDTAAVVDSDLKVHGIDGLRVADASIMPMIVGANINAPTIMIGEKASDLISRAPVPSYAAEAKYAERRVIA